MREKMQEELRSELPERVAEEWRPHRNAWPNSTPTVTLCITRGRSVGKTHQLTNQRASIGNIGGSADMQIDDPETSALHCAVAITDNGVRLYDLDSVNGTYVDDVRVQVSDLEELSTFRIGSTEFVVWIAVT